MVNNAIRFLILDRDNFTCQYCGRKPPEVRLEVDHIMPESRGGANDSTNLITACFDCNRGKNVKHLSLKKEPKEIELPPNTRMVYPILSVRVEEEIKEWLKNESFKYRSWNLFFKEVRSRYENEGNNK
jgi:hypothetical protein